jgi:transcriptional regulator with XRE-family HTH domain
MHDTTIQRRLALVFSQPSTIPADRLYALALLKITQRDVAKKAGVEPATVYQTLHDVIVSYNVASTIAAMTGLTLNQLWPCGKYNQAPKQSRRAAA